MATCEGVVLAKVGATIYVRYANKTLMEVTAITEVVWVADRRQPPR